MTTQNPLKKPQALGRVLNISTNATNAMAQQMLAAHGLTVPQWVVLSALWRRDGQLVSELSNYTKNNGPATSRILDRMAKKGFIVRKPSSKDSRAIEIHLTEHGKSLSFLGEFYRDVNLRLLEGISKQDSDLLFRLLERVENNAKKWSLPDEGLN